ncbi:hypothetical protein MHC_02225 [Mycoplasma haemocanis str. Illinois]|uniref:Uncharacterized protein n=1 Tax=Mycoplasma haemocanis (strain Illinois) TaxID=1111676 RepID=H6N6N9_MYCHN|nr:hypothetical protein [Mycoplasma haemocanis]AEW45311.1 hypothetical protein MHC_02225 [Mycoplasma haemocanis str. Illinois]
MSIKLPLFSVLGVIAVTGGYFISKSFSHKTIKDRLSNSLMSVSEDVSKWEDRLSRLKGAQGDSLVDDLREIKNSDPTSQKLKDWCVTNVESPFKDGKLLLNVKSYCTYMVRDKLSRTPRPESDGNWEHAATKLIRPDVVLSNVMKDIKARIHNTSNPTNFDALKSWCKEILDAMYENDSNFKDADSYCTNKD